MGLKIEKSQLQKYVEDGLSQREIAEKIMCSPTTVGRHMRKHGFTSKRKNGPRAGSKPFVCKSCGEKNPSKFRKQWHGPSYSKCKKCHSIEQSNRYTKRREDAIQYMGGSCCMCGYCKYNGSLHFHHLDPSEKDPNWKHLKSHPLKKITKELEKCILVCANCHGEIHGGIKGPPA